MQNILRESKVAPALNMLESGRVARVETRIAAQARDGEVTWTD